jgi:amino acid adenylation domain-containing protein
MSEATTLWADLTPEQQELFRLRLHKLSRERAEVTRAHIVPQRRDGAAAFPLSFAQQRLWFLDRLQPGNAAYHIPGAVRLSGPLDVALLARSLSEVLRRHEALRTTFPSVAEQPVQRIAPAAPLELPVTDLRHHPEAEREAFARRLAAEEARAPFDLEHGPLFRARLLRLGADDHVLVINMHHIVSDGWSLGVFVRELAAVHGAFVAGREPGLPELPVQYADFSQWQREWLQGEILERQLDYWRRQLAGGLPILELPADRPRPRFQSSNGARRTLFFPLATSAALRALSHGEGVTLFMTLLAAFKVLLHHYTGHTDLPVGTPIANRNRAEIEGLIGFFVNTLVLRTDLSGDPTFRSLLHRVQEVALGAYSHQDLPFEKLVEELRSERDPSHSPLFQVMFILQTPSQERFELPGLTLSPLELETGTAQFDLTLTLFDTGRELTGYLDYNTDLFDATTLERLLSSFETLVAAVAGDPDRRLSEIPGLPAAGRHQILAEWNDTRTLYRPAGGGLHDLFAAQAAGTPEAVALVFEGSCLTYAELNRRANQLAHFLLRRGVGIDDRVGVFMERSPEMVIALLGILKAGAAYVPFDPSYPQERLAFMLEDSRIRLLLLQDRLAGDLPAGGVRRVSCGLELDPFAGESDRDPGIAVPGEAAIYAMYTSGSTGLPKGVVNSHQGLLNRILWMQDVYGLEPDDRVLHKTSFSFDVSAWELFWPLAAGARLVVAKPGGHQDSAYLVRLMAGEGITTAHFVPPMLRVFLEEPDVVRCASLRRVICSGEALPGDVVESFHQRLAAELHNLYGPTEAAIDVTAWPCRAEEGRRGVPIGRPIANLRVHLLDAALRPAPVGVPGELHIGGVGLARGYLNRPGLTAERFIPDPFGGEPGARLYKTGDLAAHNPAGVLEFLGRNDHQVKLRGFRIELGEIETHLALHPAVRQAVVVLAGHAGRHDDALLVAYLECDREAAPSPSELDAQLKAKLPEYMIPAAYVVLTELPLTSNGKVDRAALPAPEGSEGQGQYTAPRTPVEEVVAQIWAEVLGAGRVGIHDNFFQLGGHSLLGTRLISQLSRAFEVDIPLRALFDRPTVAELSELIAHRQGEEGADAFSLLPTVEPAPHERHLPFPMTDVQQAYWVGRSGAFDLSSVAAHVYQEIEILDLDLDRLTRTVRALIERHDMLRMIVLADGQQMFLQRVPPYRIEVLDLRGLEAGTAERRIEEVRYRMSHQVFPTDVWPLFEVRVTLLDDRRKRLHVSLDLIIVDAWSSSILGYEASRLYQDPEVELVPLEISFREYVLGEMALRETPLYQRSLTYWRSRIDDLPPAPDLPLARNLSTLDKPRFVRSLGRLEADAWRRLKSRGAKLGVTPSGLLLAAFSEVLATWCKSPRFSINLTLYNRLPFHPQVHQLVGDFTSLTLLAVDNSVPGTFAERARRIQRQLWDDLDHRYVSGVEVQRELLRSQRMTSGLIMPIVFTSTLNFTRERAAPTPDQQTEAEGVFGISQTSQVLLDHQVVEGDDDVLFFIWDGVEEAFPEGMLLRDMFGAYRRLLERLDAEGDAAWQEPWREMVPHEQLALCAAVNSVAAPVPEVTLHELFAAQVERRAEAIAVVSPSGDLTYTELFRRSNQIGHRLRELGARPNRLVAVVMEKGWEQVAGTLGILAAGAAYLPIDPAVPEERLHYLLSQGEVEVALTQSRWAASLRWPAAVRPLSVDGTDFDGASVTPLEKVQSPADLAYVIFTSGSTGQPKGVMIDHRGAVNTILDLNERFAVGPQDRVLALSALSFDLSVYDIFGLLAAGGTVVLPESASQRDPGLWLELMQREGITLWDTVPALMEMLVEYAAGRSVDLPESLRLVFLSGDWIPLSLPDQVRSRGRNARVIGMGGATEASIWSILYPIGAVDPEWKSVPYGKAMVNQSFHVLDELLQPRPLWVPGDLYIGGIGLAQGYWRDAEKTAASFILHPRTGERLYRTGDLGRWLPDGNIEFLGREDLQVKVQGHRIELGEIEVAIAAHPAIAQAVISAVGPRLGNKRLVGHFVVRPAAAAPSIDELREFLHRKLPDYMVPGAFLQLERLPLTHQGKVDRKSLPEVQPPAGSPGGRAAALEGPARKVAELVARVLKIEDLDPGSSLIEMGATSVDIVRIANVLEAELGSRPRMDELFRLSLGGAIASFYQRQAERGEVYLAEPAAPPATGSPWDPLIASRPLLRDPDERERFKKRQPGLRTENPTGIVVELPGPPVDEILKQRYLDRRSRRTFSSAVLPREAFGNFLSSLRQVSLNGGPKSLYASAGGLYPIQTYLYIKPGRVEGVSGGVYYYDPAGHRLLLTAGEARVEREVYAWINQPIFDQSAFALYFIAEVDAIVPMYGALSRDFCLIEAGLMAQLLDGEAVRHGIGLCHIGGLEFERVRPWLALQESQQYVYGLLAGALDREGEAGALAAAEISDYEEGTL